MYLGEDMNMVLTSGTMPMNGLSGALAPVTGMVGGMPGGGLMNSGLPSPMQAHIPGMTAQLPTQLSAQYPGQTVLSPMLGIPGAAPIQRQLMSPSKYYGVAF